MEPTQAWPPQQPAPHQQPQGPPPGWVVSPSDGWAAPKGYAPDGRPLGTAGRRFGALLVDTLIWTVPMLALVAVMVVALVAGASEAEETADGELSGGAVALLLLSYAGIFGVMLIRLVVDAELLHRKGATWGMRALKLEVVDGRTGQRPSRGKAWGRTLFATFLSGQALGIGYWWAFFDDRKRTLHDIVCGTVVVDASGRA